MNSALRPNYRRAREIKADMDDIMNDIESAEKEGAFSRVADLKDSLHELQHAMFLTGVSSEYDL
jgi:hypothetical protein